MILQDSSVQAQAFLLRRDGKPDLRFIGSLVAESTSFSSTDRRGQGSKRWTVLAVYLTASGKLICHRITRTAAGEIDRCQALILDNGEAPNSIAIVAFFGRRPVAKKLYAQLGVIDAEEIP